MSAPDSAALIRLVRAELADCEPGQAANWREFGRRLRDLLAELGEVS